MSYTPNLYLNITAPRYQNLLSHDHSHSFTSHSLALCCQDLLSHDDSAGWILVKHNERPLSVLMSALVARRTTASDAVHVHRSIFDELPLRTSRMRKSVELFTYDGDEIAKKKVQRRHVCIMRSLNHFTAQSLNNSINHSCF